MASKKWKFLWFPFLLLYKNGYASVSYTCWIIGIA